MPPTPSPEAVAAIPEDAVYSPGQCARCGSLTDVSECGMIESSAIHGLCRDCHAIAHDELGVILMVRAIQRGDPDQIFADYVIDRLMELHNHSHMIAISPSGMAKHIFTCAMFFLSKYFADPVAMEAPLLRWYARPSATQVEWPTTGPTH